jgi:hypothetical protein
MLGKVKLENRQKKNQNPPDSLGWKTGGLLAMHFSRAPEETQQSNSRCSPLRRFRQFFLSLLPMSFHCSGFGRCLLSSTSAGSDSISDSTLAAAILVFLAGLLYFIPALPTAAVPASNSVLVAAVLISFAALFSLRLAAVVLIFVAAVLSFIPAVPLLLPPPPLLLPSPPPPPPPIDSAPAVAVLNSIAALLSSLLTLPSPLLLCHLG